MPTALSSLLGGGLLAGLVAMLRLGPDRGKIVAEGAAAAVESLRQSLAQQTEDLAQCRTECAANYKRALHAERQLAQHKVMVSALKQRLDIDQGPPSQSC